ncbi:hypothetical protein ACROYT_G013012 [Oculina patagonica]
MSPNQRLYDAMWKKLEDYYDDTSATIQAALEDLHKLKPVSETDYRGLVEFVDVVESSYSQLEELNQLNTLTMRDVDFVNGLLPSHLRLEWIRKYHDMSQTEKIQPFNRLEKERRSKHYRSGSICISTAKEEDQQIDHCAHAESASHATRGAGLALYPIQQAKVCESGKNVTIFCDGGSNTTYITHQAADRIKAKKLNRFTLDETTMRNVEKTYNTRQYQFILRTDSGKKVSITAFGMDRITGPVSKLDPKILANLFLGNDVDSLQKKTDNEKLSRACAIDSPATFLTGNHVVQIGFDQISPSASPTRSGNEIKFEHHERRLGVCLQGTHPDLKEGTEHDSNLVKTIHNSGIEHEVYHVCHVTHPEFQPNCSDPGKLVDVSEGYASHGQTNVTEFITGRTQGRLIENFICGEEIGTEITPRCGSCRCGKCPTVGHTYSFKEEQELKLIQGNLEYDGVKQCWVTSYPWLVDPGTLPNNYGSALATLKNTDRANAQQRLAVG